MYSYQDIKPMANDYAFNMIVDGDHSNTRYNSMKGEYNEYYDGLVFIYDKKDRKYKTICGSATLIKKDGKTVGYSTASTTMYGNIMQSNCEE